MELFNSLFFPKMVCKLLHYLYINYEKKSTVVRFQFFSITCNYLFRFIYLYYYINALQLLIILTKLNRNNLNIINYIIIDGLYKLLYILNGVGIIYSFIKTFFQSM